MNQFTHIVRQLAVLAIAATLAACQTLAHPKTSVPARPETAGPNARLVEIQPTIKNQAGNNNKAEINEPLISKPDTIRNTNISQIPVETRQGQLRAVKGDISRRHRSSCDSTKSANSHADAIIEFFRQNGLPKRIHVRRLVQPPLGDEEARPVYEALRQVLQSKQHSLAGKVDMWFDQPAERRGNLDNPANRAVIRGWESIGDVEGQVWLSFQVSSAGNTTSMGRYCYSYRSRTGMTFQALLEQLRGFKRKLGDDGTRITSVLLRPKRGIAVGGDNLPEIVQAIQAEIAHILTEHGARAVNKRGEPCRGTVSLRQDRIRLRLGDCGRQTFSAWLSLSEFKYLVDKNWQPPATAGVVKDCTERQQARSGIASLSVAVRAQRTGEKLNARLTLGTSSNTSGSRARLASEHNFERVGETGDELPIRLTADGYRPFEITHRLAAGENCLQVALVRPFGFLTVDVGTDHPVYQNVENAFRAFLDDQEIKLSNPQRLASGVHTLRVTHPYYADRHQVIRIADGEDKSLPLKLLPNFGWLRARTSCGADILSERTFLHHAPCQGAAGQPTVVRLPLQAGLHKLRSRLPLHADAKETIRIRVNKTTDVDLVPSPDYGSIEMPKLRLDGQRLTVRDVNSGTTLFTWDEQSLLKKTLKGGWVIGPDRDIVGQWDPATGQLKMPRQRYVFICSADRYQGKSEIFVPGPDANEAMGKLCDLAIVKHPITVRTDPPMPDLMVYLNGELDFRSKTNDQGIWYSQPLPVGTHTVALIGEDSDRRVLHGTRKIAIGSKPPSVVFIAVQYAIPEPGLIVDHSPKFPEMIVLPSGQFRILNENHHPTWTQDHVIVDYNIAMSVKEVSVREWYACVEEDSCPLLRYHNDWRRFGQYPATGMDRNDILKYVAWLNSTAGPGYRLPTEAEWEYAARAGTDARYHWGNKFISKNANCKDCDNGYQGVVPGGRFKPNKFGLYDMLGNVAEFVGDCFAPAKAEKYLNPAPNSSAPGLENCGTNVIRGGHYGSTSKDTTTFWRQKHNGFASGKVGFRIVYDPRLKP